MVRCLTVAVLFLNSLSAIPADLSGQDSEGGLTAAQRRAHEFVSRRVLNDHTFMPSRHVGQPFIAGWLRALVGGAFATGLQVPILNPQGDVIRVGEGELSAILVDAEYQQRFGSWLAVRAGATAAARIGTNSVAVIAQGAEAQYGFNLGLSVRLIQSRKVALSAVGDARFNQAYAVNLLRFIQEIIDSGFPPETELLDIGWTNSYQAGVRLAYSPSKWWGFATLGEGGLGTSFLEGQGNSAVGSFGVSAEFDLGAGTSVPLGFQAFGTWDSFSDLSPDLSDSIWRAGLVIGYTGLEAFYTGFEIGYTSLGVRKDVPGVANSRALDVIGVGLVMRHYF